MTKLYAYTLSEMEIVAVAEANTNEECESLLAHHRYDPDVYGWTHTPAFGSCDGLVWPEDKNDVEYLGYDCK